MLECEEEEARGVTFSQTYFLTEQTRQRGEEVRGGEQAKGDSLVRRRTDKNTRKNARGRK